MKLNKNLALAALVAASLFAGGAAVHAQNTSTMPVPPPPPAGGAKPPGPNLDYLAKQLGLTDDQKTKFTEAFNDQREKLKALMTDKSLSQEDRRAQARQLRDDLNTRVKGFLTADQYAKWEKMSTRHRPAPSNPASEKHSPTNAPAASN